MAEQLSWGLHPHWDLWPFAYDHCEFTFGAKVPATSFCVSGKKPELLVNARFKEKVTYILEEGYDNNCNI